MMRVKKSGGNSMADEIRSHRADRTPLNSRRYFWIVVGYYLVTVVIRATAARPDTISDPHASYPYIPKVPDPEAMTDSPDPHHAKTGHGDHPTNHDSHGIQIAKVDFEEVETPFIIALWIFCASLAKIVFHMAPRLSHIFPESCLLIVVGVVIGLLLFHTNSVHVSPLTPKTFFFYMLPPIILDAGYFMPNRLFFNNLGTILLFAVIGTLWNTFTIGSSLWGLSQAGLYGIDVPLLPTFLFSALISAVDPVAVLAVFEEIHVNEVLYIVVFGESLLNDAVTVVLYHMFEEYAVMGAEKVTAAEVVKGIASFPVVALGGTAIGIIWGFLTGFLTRFTNHVRVIEPIFIFVMAYLAYLCAETFHMSGILAITFCGITMKNYVEANISQKSHTTVKYAMKMLSSSSETIIFMFLGVSTIHDEHEWNWVFIIATIVFCSFYRIIGVIIFTALANRFRLHRLTRVDQFVMSYGGLRGAVAFALVLLIEDKAVGCSDKIRRMFVTTTITVVYFTVFVQGITIKPLVQWLQVKRADKRKPTMNERIHERLMDHTMSVMETIMGTYGHYNLRDRFKHFDNTYIRPCLVRDHVGAEPKILETYFKLTTKDAMDQMTRNANSVGFNLNKMTSESMAALLRNQHFASVNSLAGSSSSGNLPQQADNWNLDVQELEYNVSRKDMSDAKIHHLLAEELYKPPRRQRKLSYSRHAVDEGDLVTEPQPAYKTAMNFKKMVSHRHRKPGRAGLGKGENGISRDNDGHVTFKAGPQEYDNAGFTLGDEKRQGRSNTNDDGNDTGIYFIAGSGTTGDFHMDWNERRWSQLSSTSTDKSFLETAYPHPSNPISKHMGRRYSHASRNSDFDDTPTVTEISLPWRRDRTSTGSLPPVLNTNASGPLNQRPSNRFRVSPSHRRISRRDEESTPTKLESTLPWKRDSGQEEEDALAIRHEFPAWADNKEYLAYNSPTNTYLGGLDKSRSPALFGLFKRDSVSGEGSRRGSVQSRQESPRHSVGSGSYGSYGSPQGHGYHGDDDSPHHHSPQTPTLISRRNSAFAISIPEEVTEETDKDLIDIESKKSSASDVFFSNYETERNDQASSSSRTRDPEDPLTAASKSSPSQEDGGKSHTKL